MYFADFARRPINNETPNGSNPNDLDDFVEIKRQINNINKVTGHVSWKKVQSLSKNILIQESKDFRCACYYTVAATHNDGLKGLVDGLNAILDLCVIYWHSAYPEQKKANARIGAIEWMVEHAERHQRRITVHEQDLPLVEAGHRLTLRIEEELRLHYDIKSPSLGALRRIFSMWIEDVKHEISEREKAKIAPELTKAVAPSAPVAGINVEITPPKLNQTIQTEQEKKTWSPAAAVATITGIFLAALLSHFFYQDHQVQQLTLRIQNASIAQLAHLTTTVAQETDKTKQAIKEPLISRTDILLKNWDLNPIMVSQVNELEEITNNVNSLYPDSSTANQLQNSFSQQKQNLEKEYQQLHNQFLLARTVFANVKENSSNADSQKAYEYSNTLFPLLGRLEYTENHNAENELTKSQRLLNIFQHKLNLLKDDIDTESDTTR
ncbi:type VI secretion system ImpA family N-terminal domain-containing protein [uncultured Photobacterium sp.]|uniref:type VI secretion system ImpA family N-terminal domain-containing protein n=1 Tax=uncultured Photobacterium sp. TaxID=173973 RepID=UPI00262718DC|nr:type VI secretion system ImpA family N-terminal domain-containing protein [uncultured Photobacterium sp.]